MIIAIALTMSSISALAEIGTPKIDATLKERFESSNEGSTSSLRFAIHAIVDLMARTTEEASGSYQVLSESSILLETKSNKICKVTYSNLGDIKERADISCTN